MKKIIIFILLICFFALHFSACSQNGETSNKASENSVSVSKTSIEKSSNENLTNSKNNSSKNSTTTNSVANSIANSVNTSINGSVNNEESSIKYSEKGVFFSSLANSNGNGSYEKPYNSLTDLSKVKFEPGTHLYFERGSSFLGSLAINDVKGSVNSPVVITAYGKGERPKIDGNNLVGSGVLYISNCENIIVEELELFDSATTENDRRGVLITCDNNENSQEIITYKNITLNNLYVHDINGYCDAENSGMAMTSKITGGIHVWSNDGLGRVDNLKITNCQISNVSNVGLATWYHVVRKDNSVTIKKVSPYDADFYNYAHLNVHVDNNQINYIGKNAIFARHLYGGIIENNVIHDTAIRCVSGNTIVTSYVDGTIVQYNEGYRNMASPRPSDGKYQDGCMLDADLASKDTIWQYNYSHDNSFGLFLNCTYNNSNFKDVATVRYNLSVNDKGNKGVIYINYASNGIYVYNNTIVTSTDTEYVIQSNAERKSFFYNNLIYNRSPKAKFLVEDGCGLKASNNLIFNENNCNISGLDYFKSVNENGIYDKNPLFLGQLPTESVLGIKNLDCYKLANNSPALNGGKNLGEFKDFFGNDYKNSIGFYCGN